MARLAREWLLGQADASRLVVVSRSRRSGRALQTRIEEGLPAAHPTVRVLTHEGLAWKVLGMGRSSPEEAILLDRSGEWLAMREALSDARALLPRLGPVAEEASSIQDALALVSACKQAMVGPGLLAERLRGSGGALRELAVAFAAYEHTLRQMSARDVRDLPLLAVQELWDHPEQLEGWADLLLVDEAEDLSPAHWYLLRELIDRLSRPGRVAMAGDWRESIPSFRGPSSRPFEESYPRELAPAEWTLAESMPGWLTAAATAIGSRPAQSQPSSNLGEGMPSPPAPGLRARIWVAADETEEAFAVAREIFRAGLAGEVTFGEVAVLVRSAAGQLPPIVDALRVIGVPYRTERAGSAAEPVVRVVLDWLAVLCSPRDDQLLTRALRVGPRAVAKGTIRTLARSAGLADLRLAACFWRQGRGLREMPPPGRGGAGQDLEEWQLLQALAEEWTALGGGNPGLGQTALTESEFFSLLGAVQLTSGAAALGLAESDAGAALAQLERAIAAAAAAEQLLRPAPRILSDWLELVRIAVRQGGLESDGTALAGRESVAVLTVHQAKGRRWRRVFICGCATGLFPPQGGQRGLLDDQETQLLVGQLPELEEVLAGPESAADLERRVLLVALSRASEEVVCSWARRYSRREAERSTLLEPLRQAGVREEQAPRAGLVSTSDIERRLAISARAGGVLPQRPSPLAQEVTKLVRLMAPWDPVEDGPAPPLEPLSLSATSISSWLACPRQFLFGLLQPWHSDEIALTLGIAAHRLLQLLYQQRSTWNGDPARFRELGGQLIDRDLLPQIRAEASDPVRVHYARVWLGRMLERWAKGVVGPGPEATGEPIAEEIPFRLDFQGWELRGKVDALWQHPDAQIELLDYKSGESKTSGKLRQAIFGVGNDGPSDWQLPLYQIAAGRRAFAEQLGQRRPSLLRNWYVGQEPRSRAKEPFPRSGFRVGGEEGPDPEVFTDEELSRIEAELQLQAEQILAGRFPAAPRHSQRTCRSAVGGCPMALCCDGEGSVGRSHSLPAVQP